MTEGAEVSIELENKNRNRNGRTKNAYICRKKERCKDEVDKNQYCTSQKIFERLIHESKKSERIKAKVNSRPLKWKAKETTPNSFQEN